MSDTDDRRAADRRNAEWLGFMGGWQLPDDDATRWLSSLGVDDWLTPTAALRAAAAHALLSLNSLWMPDGVLDDLVVRGIVSDEQAAEHRVRCAASADARRDVQELLDRNRLGSDDPG